MCSKTLLEKRIQNLSKLVQTGDIGGALSVGRTIAGDFPNSATVQNLLGIIHYNLGNYLQAEKCYLKAVKLDPQHADAINNLGDTLNMLGRLQEAVLYYEKATVFFPDRWTILYNLGNVLSRMGQTKEALGQLEAAIALGCNSPEIFYNLGNIYGSLNKTEEAIKNYKTAIQRNFKYPQAHTNLGAILYKTENYEDAERSLRRAISIDPSYAEAYNNLGNVFLENKQLLEATTHYDKAVKCEPDLAEAIVNSGNVALKLSQYEKSRKMCSRSLVLTPNHAAALFFKGVALKQLKRHQEAINCFNKVLLIDDKDILGAELQLVGLGQKELPATTPKVYMKEFYRSVSKSWGEYSRQYNGHRLITKAIVQSLPNVKSLRIIDLGCGAGTLAPFLRPLADTLFGVDISSDMLSKAAKTGLYDTLEEKEIVEFLTDNTSTYNLAVAAAVLIHFSALEEVFEAVTARLSPRGYFCFSIFQATEHDIELTPFNMFSHAETYIDRLAEYFEYECIYRKLDIHEFQEDESIFALVFVLKKV